MTVRRVLAALTCLALLPLAAGAQVAPGKQDPDGMTFEQIQAALPEYFQEAGGGRARPADIPDVIGPGAVTRVGNISMKVTNFGHCGNFYTNLSSDPAGQWPGASGIEYLSTIRLAVAGVNPQATDPAAIRRVSYLFEWRPPTLDREDRIYKSYDGITNGTRYVNDDRDFDRFGVPRIDEDFLDGRDNDGDGKIDEDFAAVGQEEFTCLMRDDTREALNATFNEKHVPLGVEVRQAVWSYSIPGYSDFDVLEYTVFNRSGHTLDSLCIGWLVDMDAGPSALSTFFRDDFDLPGYPSGQFTQITAPNDKRLQDSTMRGNSPTNPRGISADSALCPRFTLRISGFSIADDDGDEGQTPGVPSILLINHTIDPLGISAPSRVQFAAFRSFVAQTPYAQGGNPIVDQQRFEFMVGTKPNHIDDKTGFIDAPRGDQKGDYVEWSSVGPFRNITDGASVQATIAFAIRQGDLKTAIGYKADYERYQLGGITWSTMRERYPALENALAIQIAYEGIWVNRTADFGGHPEWPFLTNGHGRETALIAALGTGGFEGLPDCHDFSPRPVTERTYEWFDYDCNYCTGVFDSKTGNGMFHTVWNVGAPPPNPDVNVASTYNYSANPDTGRVVPAGDGKITIAWNNLSEVSVDPKSGVFDFRGYKVWKAANWTRPVGSAGPNDDDWSLLGEFREFNYLYFDRVNNDSTWLPTNYDPVAYANPAIGTDACPKLYVPNYFDPATQTFVGPRKVPICLHRYDLWDLQTGIIIRPDTLVQCVGGRGACATEDGIALTPSLGCDEALSPVGPGLSGPVRETRTKYPVGRYKLVDREVKNGFLYFYSVTAFDSCGSGSPELGGRRSKRRAWCRSIRRPAQRARSGSCPIPTVDTRASTGGHRRGT